uniref:Uncharacterized protein n=1 Tax=Anopheles coluzzii TaxID=1518534 RepID=A0A8W7P662_ANOCL
METGEVPPEALGLPSPAALLAGGVGVAVAVLSPYNLSISSRLLILPIALRGISPTSRTSFGMACLGSFCSSHTSSFGMLNDSAATWSRKLITATTRWPQVSSGRPSTATSLVSGCSCSAVSISSADSLKPPDLMMSTEVRPRMRIVPFSYRAVSPVRNQPSASNSDAVSCGFCQYSRNTERPFTYSWPAMVSSCCFELLSAAPLFQNPSFSRPSSVSVRPLSCSTIRTLTPGRGIPTQPCLRLRCSPSCTYGFEMAIPISVMPYRSSNRWPVISFHRAKILPGSGAEPEIISRILFLQCVLT